MTSIATQVAAKTKPAKISSKGKPIYTMTRRPWSGKFVTVTMRINEDQNEHKYKFGRRLKISEVLEYYTNELFPSDQYIKDAKELSLGFSLDSKPVDMSMTGEELGLKNGSVIEVSIDRNLPITIRLIDQSGEVTFFKILTATKMSKVFCTFAKRKGVEVHQLRFLLDGERIKENETPKSMLLEDNDQIFVMYEQSGC